MSKQPLQVKALKSCHPELHPHERTILFYICAQLEQTGRDSVDLTIRNVADATGLCWRTVQKYRSRLLTKGVLQLLSRGRERSRYALPVGIASSHQEFEERMAVSEQAATATSADEQIAELITSIIGVNASANVLNEADLAGNKLNLLRCLRLIQANPRPPRTLQSLLSLISRLSHLTQPHGPSKPQVKLR